MIHKSPLLFDFDQSYSGPSITADLAVLNIAAHLIGTGGTLAANVADMLRQFIQIKKIWNRLYGGGEFMFITQI